MYFDPELSAQVKQQVELSRRLYQLCSLTMTRLSNYEDTSRFDDTLMNILQDMPDTSFTSAQLDVDPTQLI